MERDELLELCERYVRRRRHNAAGRADADVDGPPVVEIVDGYLHAEISESEKNSLLAYVRGIDHEHDEGISAGDLDVPVLADLDEPTSTF